MSRLLSLLSICRKANCLVMGYDRVQESIQSNRAKLLILTEDLSFRARERITARANNFGIPVYNLAFSSDDVWRIVGKKAAAIAVTDEKLAQRAALQIDNDEEGTHI